MVMTMVGGVKIQWKIGIVLFPPPSLLLSTRMECDVLCFTTTCLYLCLCARHMRPRHESSFIDITLWDGQRTTFFFSQICPPTKRSQNRTFYSTRASIYPFPKQIYFLAHLNSINVYYTPNLFSTRAHTHTRARTHVHTHKHPHTYSLPTFIRHTCLFFAYVYSPLAYVYGTDQVPAHIHSLHTSILRRHLLN